jgi:RHS repeat-associated core domain
MQQSSTDVKTCYVYDDFGRLRYVLPPLAVDRLNNTVIITDDNDVLNKYAYIYKYDERGRVIKKKIPGCDPVTMIYDSADRLIFSQDGNQAKTGKWTFSIPDKLGRPVITGVVSKFNNTAITANNIQTKLITATFNAGNTTQAGYDIYINNSIVTLQDFTLLTVNYYDNYNFLQTLLDETADSINYQESEYGGSRWNSTTELLTGTRTYILDNSETYTTTAIYYDYKGQVVQTRSTNHLGGYDIAYNKYNFTGNVTSTQKEHTTKLPAQGKITEVYTYYYDHAGRPTETHYKLNNNNKIILAKNIYDELGRLIEKKRNGGSDTETFNYNIRNQITQIQSGAFVQNLYYNADPTGQNSYWNGNISYSTWTYDGYKHGFSYGYDELNRLTYTEFNNGNPNLPDLLYKEVFGHDKMGNITSLVRTREDLGRDIDDLEFTYNGNQITNIRDYAGSSGEYNIKEYHNRANETIEFEYDANGNMTKDLDREITKIEYNILNLPDKVTFANENIIVNLYDASGKKLSSGYLTKTGSNIEPRIAVDIISELATITTTTTTGRPILEATQLLDLILGNPLGASFSSASTNTTTSTPSSAPPPGTTTNPGIVPGTTTNPGIERFIKTYYEGYGTEYVGNIEYETEISNSILGSLSKEYSLNRIHNAEGYVVADNQYYYYRRDHLGNNREVWNANTGQIVQRTQYYPSGLPMESFDSDNAGLQPYKYNGKEFIEAHGYDMYDYHARGMYPAIMRFTTIDPLAEKYYSISPYAYCANNPINAIDPDGRLIIFVNGFDRRERLSAAGGQIVANQGGGSYGGSFVYSSNRDFQIKDNYGWEKVDEFYKRTYKDGNALYVSGSYEVGTSASTRYSDGIAKAQDLIAKIKSGEITLSDGETIKLVGYSMGAAYAAGMASVLANSEYKDLLQFVDYIAPHQPTGFKHPKGVKGRQIVSTKDWLAGSGAQIENIKDENYFGKSFGGFSDVRGHMLSGELNRFIQECINAGVTVTVYE